MRPPTPEELYELEDLDLKSQILNLELQLKTLKLKQKCGVPAFARLHELGEWCHSDGKTALRVRGKSQKVDV